MNTYQKPCVIELTSSSEGVYMASGDTCYIVNLNGDATVTTAWYKHFELSYEHTGAHEAKDVLVTFTFNQNVDGSAITAVQVQGYTASVRGSTVVARYAAVPSSTPFINVWTTDTGILNSLEIISASATCAED